MRLTKLERKAAAAVLVMTATVVVSGVRLLRKHSRYMAQKAAAFFKDEKDEETAQEAENANEPEVISQEATDANDPEAAAPETAKTDETQEAGQESGPESEENMG